VSNPKFLLIPLILWLCACSESRPESNPDVPVSDDVRIGTDAKPIHIYIADFELSQILRFDGLTGSFIDVVATSQMVPELERPTSVDLGPDGRLYATGFRKGAIVRIDEASSATRFFHDQSLLEEPARVLFLDQHLYALGNDTRNVVVVELSSGRYVRQFGFPAMRYPHDFVIGPRGLLYVVVEPNPHQGAVQVWRPESGTQSDSFAARESGDLPVGITIGPDGLLYVSDWHRNRITRHDPDTRATLDVFVPPDGELRNPGSLRFGPDGRLYVVTRDGMLRFDGETGEFIDLFIPLGSGGMVSPQGFCFGPPLVAR
jgi:streptogramin lyase